MDKRSPAMPQPVDAAIANENPPAHECALLRIDGALVQHIPGHLSTAMARSLIVLAGQIAQRFCVVLPDGRRMMGEEGDYLVVDGECMAIVPRIAFGELFEVPEVPEVANVAE